MPSFEEILKIAVEEQDWQIICGLYTNITGEPLSVPEAVVQNEPQEEKDEVLTKDYDINELRKNNVDSHSNDEYNEFTVSTRGSEFSHSGDSSGRKAKAQPVKGRDKLTNVVGVSEEGFVDDGTESLINPDTGKPFAQENKNVKITPRNKRSSLGMNDTGIVNVECSICNESYNVSKLLAHGYSKTKSQNTWKCNDCNTRKSRLERSRNA